MLSDLEELKILMDEAEESENKEESKESAQKKDNSENTEVVIYDETGNQLALTDEYNNCKETLLSILDTYNNTIEPLSKSVQKGIITEEDSKLFEDATLKARKDLEHFVNVTYESVFEKMTIMEQKEIEEICEQLQTYISQCVTQVKLCSLDKKNLPAASDSKSTEVSNKTSSTALTKSDTTALTTKDTNTDVASDKDNYETTVHKNIDEINKNIKVTSTIKQELDRLFSLTAQQTLELFNLRLNQVLKVLNYASLPIAIAQDGIENVARAIKKSFSFLSEFANNLINGIKNVFNGKVGDIAKELMDLTPLSLFIKDQGSLLFQLIQIPFKLIFLVPDAWKKTVGPENKKKQKLEKELKSKINAIRTDKNLTKEQKEDAIQDLRDEYNDLIKDVDKSGNFGMNHTKSTLNKINVNKSKISTSRDRAERLNNLRQKQVKKAKSKVLNGLKDAINNALS